LVAGCAAPSSPPGATDWSAIERQVGDPLAHNAPGPADHFNLHLVAQSTGEPGRTPQATEGFVESAVKGGYAYLCRTGPDEGLVIFDVHDVEHPKFVSYLKLDAGFEADVEVSDDGHWAFWETQRFPTSAEVPSTDPGTNAPHGIHIVDISDKAHPKWVGFTPVAPDGPHSITYANLTGPDGKAHHIVLASTYAFAYAYEKVAVPTAQRLVIMELDTSLPVAQLKTLAEWSDPNATEANPALAEGGKFPHDVSIAVNPFTHKTYAYVAYWNLGVDILDMTDPAHPVKVGQATDFGPTPYREIHMARQFPSPIDGRVIMVAEPEIGDEPDTGAITMFDVTNPAHPTYVSTWLKPGNHTSAGGSLGPHYFDVRDGRVAMASYQAGFWVFDVHDRANLAHPRTVAYSLVNATSTGPPMPGPLAFLNGANAFDAWWADETHVVGSDVHGGLSIFRYEGPTPAQVTG
ncbi:MAG: LVIVD repeat-containing protein, partial [Thermoplasmatota archaeon]